MQEKVEVGSGKCRNVYVWEYALDSHWGIMKLPEAFKIREAGDSQRLPRASGQWRLQALEAG